MPSRRGLEPVAPLSGEAGRRDLARLSSLAVPEPLTLPLELQRSGPFLALIAAASMAAVGAAAVVQPFAGVAMVIGIALAFAVALNHRLGLVLLAVMVPMTSGLARGLPAPGLRLSELVVGLVATVLLVTARRRVRWTALDWVTLLYALATAALGSYDLLLRDAPFSQEGLGTLLGPFQFLLLYRAVAVSANEPESRRLVVRLLLLSSVPVALLAIGQQFDVPGFRSFVATLTGTDIYAEGGGRATGPFPHWHNLGGYLFAILLLVAGLLLAKVRGVLSQQAIVAIAIVDAIALIQALSIAPIFGVVAGALILGVWLGGLSRMALGLAAAALVAVLLFGSQLESRSDQQFTRSPGSDRSPLVPQTVQHRYDLWTSELLPNLEGYWVTGYGPDLPPELQDFPYTESLYIGLLYRGGVILLAIWLLLAVVLAVVGWRSARSSDPLQRALGAALVAALVCLVFMHFMESYFIGSGTPQVLWIMAGLLAFRELRPGRPGDAGQS
jgi:hypothetical protein